MNKLSCKEARLNRKGYTIFLLFSLLIMVVFWRMFFTAKEIGQYMRLQKKAMVDSGITVSNEELPAFELN